MYAALTSWENLLRAWRDAARSKRRQPEVAAFEHRLEDNLAALRRELLDFTYRPGGYESFYINEPKRRLISAASFRDRVVHHALVNVLEPLFERRFIADSYANRRGKGTHRALDRCQYLARRHPYVLQLDLRQFFPSIDHAILRHLLAAQVQDSAVLWLIDRILASGAGVLSEAYEMVWFPNDGKAAVDRPRGLPIGNLTSQFWGNVYLDPLDHFVKRELRIAGYVRYVDDLLLFGTGRKVLWAAHRAVTRRLERLRLTIHAGAHPRPVAQGIPFLGFVVFPKRRRLKRRKGVSFPELGVLAVYLFGSQAAGRAHRESDVDLAVLLDRGRHPTTADRFDLRLRLMADAMIALGTNEVDLVILNDLPPLFARSILYEGRKLFVADAAADRDFTCQVQLLAADLAPWLARMRTLKLAALER